MTADEANIGIRQLQRYGEAKKALEEQEERARTYLEMIKTHIEQDLSPLREEVSAARESLEAFVRTENGGEKYRVPGLGTAYLSTRRQTTIVDEEAFAAVAWDYWTEEIVDQEILPRKLSVSAAKKYASEMLENTGEALPGVENEEIETLNVRLS